MIPILAGLVAALAWALSTLASARSSRLVGGPSTLAGMALVGLVATVPLALASPAPTLSGSDLLLAAMSGAGYVAGLLLTYAALRIGAVGLVATILSIDGAIAALLSVLVGEILAPGAGAALVVIALGVALAAAGGGQEVEEGVPIPRERSLRTVALGLGAALSFGIGLYAVGRIGTSVPTAWAILPARVVGVVVAIPLALAGRIRFTREALPFMVVTGLADMAGYWAYVTGAREGIAITAVVATLFAPMSAIAAFALFRERLGRQQLAGIVVVVIGVTILGALQG